MVSFVIVKAKELRKKAVLDKVPNSPGMYEIFAKEDDVKALLSSKYISKGYFGKIFTQDNINKGLIVSIDFEGEKYYRIYVGIATDESLRDRLDRHINRSARVSTLRRSIAALISGDQSREGETNDFLDKLVVRYTDYPYKVKSREARKEIGRLEKEEMQKTILPLNIRDNHRDELKDFKSDLKKARTEAKNKGKKNAKEN